MAQNGEAKVWYHKGLRFKCTQCGACCTNRGDYRYVYLAEADIRAISGHLGLKRADFLRRYCRREEGWVLLRMDQPACPFLGADQRCQVYPVRPKQCATWPFWVENLNRATWEGPVAAGCPGIGRGPLYSAEHAERVARETEDWYEA